MSARLKKSERDEIILNESKGIHHPLYYCFTDCNGKILVRKRKIPLDGDTPAPTPTQTPVSVKEVTQAPEQVSTPQAKLESSAISKKPEVDYDAVTNKQLLDRLVTILEGKVVSKDQNLNSVENEKVTEGNKRFVEQVKTKAPMPVLIRRRGRTLF